MNFQPSNQDISIKTNENQTLKKIYKVIPINIKGDFSKQLLRKQKKFTQAPKEKIDFCKEDCLIIMNIYKVDSRLSWNYNQKFDQIKVLLRGFGQRSIQHTIEKFITILNFKTKSIRRTLFVDQSILKSINEQQELQIKNMNRKQMMRKEWLINLNFMNRLSYYNINSLLVQFQLLMNDGRKRKAPKHQNKTVFKIQFDPLSLEMHKKVSYKGLCKRCADQLSWKIKYNKYKKMTEPAKCTFCHQKNVSRTYMRACEGCMSEKNVCPKCLETETEEQIEVKLNQIQKKKQDQQEERKMNEFLKTLKQRSRRTVKRLHEKGTISWNNEQQQFLDQEGNVLPVQFRQGYGTNKQGQSGQASQDEQFDQFGSDLDDDEQEEEKEHQKANNKEKQVKAREQVIKDKGKESIEVKVNQKQQKGGQKQQKQSKHPKSEDQAEEQNDDDYEDINEEDDVDKQEETEIKQSKEEAQVPKDQTQHPKQKGKAKGKKGKV